MSDEQNVYDQVEIEDMVFDPDTQMFEYPCPCGDKFQVCLDDLVDDETDIAVCPSCSLTIQVIFEKDDLQEYLDQTDQPLAQEIAV